MAIGAILGNILKTLVLNKAKEEAEKTGASPNLIDAFTKQISKGEKKTSEEIKDSDLKGEGAPEIEITDRTFEEQLGFKPEEAPELLSTPDLSATPTAPSIPSNFRQMVVPGPGGRQITGQGVGTQPQNVLQPQTVPPGILAGLKQGALNLPTTAGQIPAERTGRRTAFATGKTLGDFLRSQALKLPTTQPVSPNVPLLSRAGETIGQIPRGGRFQPQIGTETEAQRVFKKFVGEEDVLGGDKRKRAKQTLQDAGRASDDKSVDKFLKLNPDF